MWKLRGDLHIINVVGVVAEDCRQLHFSDLVQLQPLITTSNNNQLQILAEKGPMTRKLYFFSSLIWEPVL